MRGFREHSIETLMALQGIIIERWIDPLMGGPHACMENAQFLYRDQSPVSSFLEFCLAVHEECECGLTMGHTVGLP